MEWYMFIIYSILITGSMVGGVSAYLNFRLQRKWYLESHSNETTEEKIKRLLKTPMPNIKPKDGL